MFTFKLLLSPFVSCLEHRTGEKNKQYIPYGISKAHLTSLIFFPCMYSKELR